MHAGFKYVTNVVETLLLASRRCSQDTAGLLWLLKDRCSVHRCRLHTVCV